MKRFHRACKPADMEITRPWRSWLPSLCLWSLRQEEGEAGTEMLNWLHYARGFSRYHNYIFGQGPVQLHVSPPPPPRSAWQTRYGFARQWTWITSTSTDINVAENLYSSCTHQTDSVCNSRKKRTERRREGKKEKKKKKEKKEVESKSVTCCFTPQKKKHYNNNTT